MPSLAPRTAARSQPMCLILCFSFMRCSDSFFCSPAIWLHERNLRGIGPSMNVRKVIRIGIDFRPFERAGFNPEAARSRSPNSSTDFRLTQRTVSIPRRRCADVSDLGVQSRTEDVDGSTIPVVCGVLEALDVDRQCQVRI